MPLQHASDHLITTAPALPVAAARVLDLVLIPALREGRGTG
jgi:hypothetical protein